MSNALTNPKEEEEIDVNIPGPSRRRSSARATGNADFSCPYCEFVGDSRATTNFHVRQEHPKGEIPRRIDSKPPETQVKPARETTKQLIGTRKKPENISNPTTSENIIYQHQDDNLMQEDYIEVSNEVEINEEMNDDESRRKLVQQQVNSYVVDVSLIGENKKKNSGKIGAPRKKTPGRQKVYDPKNLPFRLRVGDINGKYACYVQDCDWKGGYRSLRMDHMRAVHPEWKMPSRYLLQRISKDGVYIDPENYVPPFECTVEGCEWRGNFRASRSAHIKQAHPGYYVENKKKTSLGSYHAEGQYLCHLAECDWRGASRSTRATHMKKEHPHFRMENMRSAVMLECFACGTNVPTQFGLINHIEEFHGLGNHIEQTFEKKSDFLVWVATVERFYSCEFAKRIKSGGKEDEVLKFQLTCACHAQKNAGFITVARNVAYSTIFLKKRAERIITRRKIDCCLYLDVNEDPASMDGSQEGKIYVRGCLEHTGHRWGTPLLRSTVLDRQMFQEFMTYRNTNRKEMSMHTLLDVLCEIEGFTIDNMEQVIEHESPVSLDPDASISLGKLIENDEDLKNCTWGANLPLENSESADHKISIGIMSEEMKRYWKSYGRDRVAIIDQANIELNKYSLNVFFVLVLDNLLLPKVACVYITSMDGEDNTGHEELIEFLYSVDPQPPRVFVSDPSQVWIEIISKFWPDIEIDVQISEWTLLDYWADVVEKEVPNQLDRFHLMCALRRMLRLTDMQQFIYFCVELFEALHEVDNDSFAKFMDVQLSDSQYFKRWSPLHRSDLTSHNNPTLSLACRYFRERFLNPQGLPKIDQYVVVLKKRIEEFNQCIGSETYTLRPLDPLRNIYYPTAVYEERYAKIVAAEGGADIPEVFTEEIVDYNQIIYEEVPEHQEQLEAIPKAVQQQPPHRYIQQQHQQQHQENLEKPLDNILQDDKPSTSTLISGNNGQHCEDQVFDEEFMENDGEVHEDEMLEVDIEKMTNDDEEMIDVVGEPPRKIMRHETTKAVIGQRRPKNRIRLSQSNDLSSADRIAIREIAAHVIDLDGRKSTAKYHPSAIPIGSSMYSTRIVQFNDDGKPDEVFEEIVEDEVVEECDEIDMDPNQPSTSNGQRSSVNW